MRRPCRYWLHGLVLGLLALPTTLAAQERGTVTGEVVSTDSGQPLAGVRISVAGTTLGAVTNQEGRYEIPNVPAGQRQIRAAVIGYSQAAESVQVLGTAPATANFTLSETAVPLEGVVVTATGERQRLRERGNVVGQIQVGDVALASINRMSDLLQGRSAGVVVQQPSGTSGTGARVRIRGSASASLSNQPLIVVDGVRVSDAPESFSISVGGQSVSRLEDINPDDIDSIEILKGPAAAALYGTATATGVVQITTRQGRAGPARWNAYTAFGLLHERNDWPGNYLQLGVTSDGEEVPCWTFDQAAGACSPTELLSWNPLMDRSQGHGVSNPELGPASPFRDGSRQKYGLNVSGGSDLVTYFISGEIDEEKGIFSNNTRERVSLRGNFQSQLRDDFELSLSTGWITSDAQMPWGDNATGSVIGGAITGEPEDDPERRGYELHAPDRLALVDTRQGLSRLTGSVNANYRPLPWLSVLGTGGLDVLNRHDSETLPPETIMLGSFPDGRRISNRIEVRNYTASLGGTATAPLSSQINSTTSAGLQYHREAMHGTYGLGWELLPGTGSLAGTSARYEVNESNQDVVMIGAYVQQQVAYQDRVFLTGALRGDDNSAFGADYGLVWYPSLSASWVIDEEPWFPRFGPINSLRLRGAIGRSGLRPDFRDAITYFSPVAATVDARDAPAYTVGGVGDPELRPEISTEIETGFDVGMFDGRLGLELTYYDKTSRDALIARRLAPSLGMATTRFENIGEVSNRGVEALLRGRVLDVPKARWNATLSIGTNRNRLVKMDGDPIIFGLASGQRHVEGFPMGGYWQTPYAFSDPDADGLLRIDDVVMRDSMEYAGTPFPKRNIAFSSDVTLFDVVRISGLIEHQGGHTLWSGTHEWQCVFLVCSALNRPTTSLEEQARAIGTYAYFSWWGYLEDASFTKLRDVSVTFTAPPDLARRWRLKDVSLTLSGRNLATWTDYTGIDPEVNFAGQDNFTTAEFQSQPPIRHWTARVDVAF